MQYISWNGEEIAVILNRVLLKSAATPTAGELESLMLQSLGHLRDMIPILKNLREKPPPRHYSELRKHKEETPFLSYRERETGSGISD